MKSAILNELIKMLNIYLVIVNYNGKPTILLNRIKTNKDKLRN